jgi:hypothetical protein
MYRKKLIFYGEELVPRPTPKLEDYPLSPVRDCIDSQLPSKTGGFLLHPQPEDAPCRGDKGPTQHGQCLLKNIFISFGELVYV